MGNVDMVEKSAGKKRNKRKRRKKRRLKIRVDMTPMVDIVMLLLIFYMVTTVFTMPQAMEINLPPDSGEPPPPIKYSKLLMLRVDQDNHIYWSNWDPLDSLPKAVPSKDSTTYQADQDSILSIMQSLHISKPDLSTVMKIHPEARYDQMVDLLDEVDRMERFENRRRSDLLNIPINDVPDSLRFSYRYAIGEWEDRDSDIAAECWAQFQEEGGDGKE